MENTLQVGDRVLVNKLAYRFGDIQRGDIIVFNGVDSWAPRGSGRRTSESRSRVRLRSVAGAFGFATPNEKDYIKRVIGLPGDEVQCCDKQGRITVNGDPTRRAIPLPRRQAVGDGVRHHGARRPALGDG